MLRLVLLLLLFGCSDTREALEQPAVTVEAIENGSIVAAGAWPNVVWLSNGCTATLLHESLVVFAAHCGTEHEQVWIGEDFGANLDPDTGEVAFDTERGRSVPVEDCRALEDAGIDSGTDLAYCKLRELQRGVPIVPPAIGCERAQLAIGSKVVLVGYGLDQPTGSSFGIKRVTTTTIQDVGDEIVAGDGASGTCRGDSGGPAFMRMTSSDRTRASDWRMIGVMSSGIRGRCGTGWYTDLAKFVDWIESTSGVDITPCSNAAGDWNPSEACRVVPLDDQGLPTESEPELAATCGPAFSAASDCSVRGIGAENAHGAGSLAMVASLALVALRARRWGARS